VRVLSATELARMRTAQADCMQDACQLGTQTAISTRTGPEPMSATWTWATAIACGVEQNPSGESGDGSESPIAQAAVRVPTSTTIANVQRVKVTKRYGETLTTPIIYGVVGEPERGPSAIVIRCDELTGNAP